MKTATGRACATAEVGLALALTLGAIGAGYFAGKASADRVLARTGVELVGEAEPASTISAKARMEGVLLFLLGREGAL